MLVHFAISGGRVAVTLAALALGRSTFEVGILIAVFATLPMLSSVKAGRIIDLKPLSEAPAKVKYVWSLDGKQVHEYPLDIKSSGRWWAAKNVQTGSWKVEVQSESGESLGSVEFTVGGEAKAAPAPAPATK